jgi:hypothetical protein
MHGPAREPLIRIAGDAREPLIGMGAAVEKRQEY